MGKEKVEILVEGGKASAGPVMGQKFGPLKVDIQKILEEINKKTVDFKGMKVPVIVLVDTKDKSFEIEIGTPPVSELIKNEVGLDKGSGVQKIKKSGNMSMEQVIKISKMKKDSMLTNDLKSIVKTVIGSCGSLGLLVEGKTPVEINEDINKGLYDELIKSEKTEPSSEKLKQLKEDLVTINAALEKEFSKELTKAGEKGTEEVKEDTKAAPKKEEKKKK